MKISMIKTAFALAAMAALFTGCANNDDYESPLTECVEPNITANKTVEEVADMATGFAVQWLPADNSIIEAYVTSNDERGNFFKSISLQTMPSDGSDPIGFSVAIDETTLFGRKFVPGRKVYVIMDSLYYARVDGSLKIGALFEGEVGRISIFDYEKSVIASCTQVDEDMLVREMTIAEALDDSNINTLIELQGVQFKDEFVGTTYYDEDDEENTAGGATNRYLVDAAGNDIIFRTSSFANFSGNVVPDKSGKVRGVLTKFESDYQFVARAETDIMLTEPRIDNSPPLVGGSITYSGSFTENFESYPTTSPGNRNFASYINDAATGSRYWFVTSFGGNKYIQMSSFGGTPEANRSLFIVPVDMTAASSLSFKTKGGFNNGQVLKVFYSLDYVPGENINDATLVDITSSFAIDPGPASGYTPNFLSSGAWSIPAGLTGNGYIIFQYIGNGSGGPTTTMQIDDIVVN